MIQNNNQDDILDENLVSDKQELNWTMINTPFELTDPADEDRVTDKKIEQLQELIDYGNANNLNFIITFAEDVFTVTDQNLKYAFAYRDEDGFPSHTEHFFQMCKVFDIVRDNPNHIFYFRTALRMKDMHRNEYKYSLGGVKTFTNRYLMKNSYQDKGYTHDDIIDHTIAETEKKEDVEKINYFRFRQDMPNLFISVPVVRYNDLFAVTESFLREGTILNEPLSTKKHIYLNLNGKGNLELDKKHHYTTKPAKYDPETKEIITEAEHIELEIGDLVDWVFVNIPENSKYSEKRLSEVVNYFTDKGVPIWISCLGRYFAAKNCTQEITNLKQKILDAQENKNQEEVIELQNYLIGTEEGCNMETFPKKFQLRQIPNIFNTETP